VKKGCLRSQWRWKAFVRTLLFCLDNCTFKKKWIRNAEHHRALWWALKCFWQGWQSADKALLYTPLHTAACVTDFSLGWNLHPTPVRFVTDLIAAAITSLMFSNIFREDNWLLLATSNEQETSRQISLPWSREEWFSLSYFQRRLKVSCGCSVWGQAKAGHRGLQTKLSSPARDSSAGCRCWSCSGSGFPPK